MGSSPTFTAVLELQPCRSKQTMPHHPLDHETAKLLRLWCDRLQMGDAGEPMGQLTDDAIKGLQAFRERRQF